jgi:hypothetical protein
MLNVRTTSQKSTNYHERSSISYNQSSSIKQIDITMLISRICLEVQLKIRYLKVVLTMKQHMFHRWKRYKCKFMTW